MKILSDTWRSNFSDEQFELVKSLAADMPEAVMLVDAQEGNLNPPILHVNQAFTRLTGYTPEEIVGKTPKILQGPKTEPAVLERLSALVERAGEKNLTGPDKARTDLFIKRFWDPLRKACEENASAGEPEAD